MEPREGLQKQLVLSSPYLPGPGSNTSRNNVQAEMTRSLVPRLPLRNMLSNGADEFYCRKNLKIYDKTTEANC
jgi:hypothetical protein